MSQSQTTPENILSHKKVAIYGSGPAGLMAASILVGDRKKGGEHQLGAPHLFLFEKRPSFGRKLLIAGSSGLNISHDAPIDQFIAHYKGFTPEVWARFFKEWSPTDWIKFVQSLGLETFLGTSDRYFVREMKASGLLKAWTESLVQSGVQLVPNHEWKSFDENKNFNATGFFLGGGSWEDATPSWIENFKNQGIETKPFYPTNVGYEVAWTKEFLLEAEGKPLKGVRFTNSQGEKLGELIVTKYGLEGTPIYFFGATGTAWLDLQPTLTADEIKTKLLSVKENLSPMRRVKKTLQLCDASLALLFHHTPEEIKKDLPLLITQIKRFPIHLLRPRPLSEAISSGGGISLNELSLENGKELMLKKMPGIFCGGEMLDWTAPTGGFLIQGCVTQGAVIGKNILQYLRQQNEKTNK